MAKRRETERDGSQVVKGKSKEAVGTSHPSGRETIDEVFQLFILENGGPPRPPISTEFSLSLSVEIFDDTIHGGQRETDKPSEDSVRVSVMSI